MKGHEMSRPGVRLLRVARALAAIGLLLFGTAPMLVDRASADDPTDHEQTVPPALRGPFVSRRDVVVLLDCPSASCQGPLNFTRLIEARLPPGSSHTMSNDNAFNHKVAKEIASTIRSDILERSAALGET